MVKTVDVSTDKELTKVLQGVDEGVVLEINEAFAPFFDRLKTCDEKSKKIKITSADQVEEIALAKESLKAIVDIRIELDKKRKSLKGDSLRKGKAIDGLANFVKYLIAPIEERLKEQTDFVKRQEEKRKLEVAEERKDELAKYEVDCSFYNLSDMEGPVYANLLEASKGAHKLAVEAKAKAEKDRIKAIQQKKEDDERLAEENRKLMAEQAEKDKELEAEREKSAKLAEDIRVKNEASEVKRKAEQEAAAEAAKADRDAQLAPDKEKLELLATQIDSISVPFVESDEAGEVIKSVVSLLSDVIGYIREKSINL